MKLKTLFKQFVVWLHWYVNEQALNVQFVLLTSVKLLGDAAHRFTVVRGHS